MMNASPAACMPGGGAANASAPGSAQLLIHAGGNPREHDGIIDRLLLGLRGLVAQRRAPLPTDLRIADLQGRPCFAADNTLALVAVHLPAGTYHVSARLGSVQRRYTLTLERGATVDLYLRLPQHQQHGETI